MRIHGYFVGAMLIAGAGLATSMAAAMLSAGASAGAAVGSAASRAQDAEEVEILAYALPGGDSGLRIAWRPDSAAEWTPLMYDFVRNDFGPWGSHKKMYAPRLIFDTTASEWVATWEASASGDVVAMAASPDLRKWGPQAYYASALDLPRHMIAKEWPVMDSVAVEGVMVRGGKQRVDRALIDSLRSFVASRNALGALYAEQAKDDAGRFAGLAAPRLKVTPRPEAAKEISDKLIGIFFEDINYGADGGLYAELLQNRDFEYLPSDRSGDPAWNSTSAWTTSGEGSMEIKTANPLHPNNPHYASLEAGAADFELINSGFDGIAVKRGERYDFSVKARSERPLTLRVSLQDAEGCVIASGRIKVKGGEWTAYSADLRPSQDCADARLAIALPEGARLDVDMVSLFPAKTFKGRKNGLRADLAQLLADIKPRFVRFPGGCVAHGDGIDNIYDWKGSIGALEERRPLRNLWGYHQSRGLGYHEYFLFCEDIGAEPLPVVAAGVPCQNSGTPSRHSGCTLNTLGQQCGVPLEDMDAYIRDILDLIEYANGDVSTPWGAKRAAAGHPQPFNLKYLGIGNEDMITEVFEPRFKMIYEAVSAAHPEITVVGTAGPFYEGTDYEAGWALARRLGVPMVDEHYYVSPGWLIYNQDFYDSYPRGGSKVYLGEYASHLPGRPNNVETALSDALYLTGVERNGDVVAMTSYAPLLAKKGHTQWNPDMIYFDNVSVAPTVEYQVQKLYGNNSGDVYIPSDVEIDSERRDVTSRIGVSIVKDSASGDYILKMVNMLPVEVETELDLSALGVKATSAKGEVLAGAPDSRDAVAVPTQVTFPRAALPPYSFTVVRTR